MSSFSFVLAIPTMQTPLTIMPTAYEFDGMIKEGTSHISHILAPNSSS